MSVGSRIKSLRNERGLSQSQLANLIGIEKAMIGRWETTLMVPSKKHLKSIAAAFGLTVEEFINPRWLGFTDPELDRIKATIKSLSPSNQLLIESLIQALTLSERKKP